MADLSQTIKIIFDGVDNTATALSSINKGFGDLAGNLEEVTQPFADLTKGILAMDTAAAALGLTLVAWSTGAAAKFETGINLINTNLDLSPELMGKFSEDILKYGETSTQTFEQINQAIYDATSAGVKYEDSLDVIRIAENLAVAGKASLNEAINLLVPTLNAYGAGMDEAGKYSDVFFTTVKLGKTTIPELSAALGQLAPTAAAVGVPIETIGAALATLTANGIGTSEATTGLKAALSNIIKPSEEAKKAAEELGVGFGVTELKSQGLEGMLQALYKATGGNVTEMARFFGSTEALNSVLSLTSGSSEKFVGNLKAMESSAGATADAYKIMADTLANANVQLGNAIESLAIKLGQELLPKVTEISKGLTGVFKGLGEGLDDGAFDVPIEIVNKFLSDIADLLQEAAKNLPEALALIDWSRFEESFEGLREAFGGIFDGIELDTPEGLAKVIQTVIDLFSGLVEVSSGVIEGLRPLFEIVGGLVKGFTELSPETQKMIGLFLGLATTTNVLSGYAKGFSEAISAVSAVFSSGGGLITSLTKFAPVLAAVGVAFAAFKLGEFIGEASGFNAATDKLIEKLNGVPDAAKPADKALKDAGTTLNELGNSTDEAGKRLSSFNEKVESGELVFDSLSNSWVSGLGKINESTGLTIKTWDEFNKLVEDGTIFQSKLTGEWEKAGTASNEYVKTTQNLIDVEKDLNPALKEQYEAMGLAADGTKKLATATDDVKLSQGEYTKIVLDLDEALANGSISREDYNSALEKAGKQAGIVGTATKDMAAEEDKAAKTAKELAEETEKFALEWEKLASQERVAIFEASATIAVAQIEADASRAVAAMEMLSSSFANTGDVLKSLFDLWSGVEDLADQSKIEEWINREYEIREKIAQGQLDMIAAEIKRMEAQTRLLEQGGVELKITSDGLEPALEAFMFAVIDKVRVNVAGSYEEFLLGCGGA